MKPHFTGATYDLTADNMNHLIRQLEAAWKEADKMAEAVKEAKYFFQDQLARINKAIATDCPNCDYQCEGCLGSIDDCEYVKGIVIKALASYEQWKGSKR